jgi:hypothetical protein
MVDKHGGANKHISQLFTVNASKRINTAAPTLFFLLNFNAIE